MATAKIENKTRTEMVPKTVIEKRVILDLSEDEAGTLLTLFHFISGDTQATRRKHTVAMGLAIREALGISGWQEPKKDDLHKDDCRGLRFIVQPVLPCVPSTFFPWSSSRQG